MKAIVIDAYGGPEVLQLRDVDAAQPGPGEVLVDVAVAGVNFMDTGVRRGILAGRNDGPVTPGVEGAGRVVALGSGVTDLNVGDRVAWFYVPGSYAEQLVAPAAQLVPLPDDIDFDIAAGLMMQGLTASNLATEVHAVKPGDVALIHAAAGGVGLLLTQVVKLLGGRVIARVSRQEKVALAKEAGADHVIVDDTGNFADEVLRLTEGAGVQVAYDGTGAESFAASLAVVDFHGTLALYGPLFEKSIEPFSPWSLPKSIKVTYPIVHHHVRNRERLLKYSNQLFDWVRSGKLRVSIGHRYPLADASQAHSDIQSRRTTGKLLLIP